MVSVHISAPVYGERRVTPSQFDAWVALDDDNGR
jgi:hypothetical protein